MNKYLFLAFLFILTSFVNVGLGHIHGNAVQENILIDYKLTDEKKSFDDPIGNKIDTTLHEWLLAVITILLVTNFVNLLSSIKKRYVNITPIFYQSNYVIIPPTN